jgi:hypothetical protein
MPFLAKAPADSESDHVCVNCQWATRAHVVVGRLYTLLYDCLPVFEKAVQARPKRDPWVQAPPAPPLSRELTQALRKLATTQKWTVKCRASAVTRNKRLGRLSCSRVPMCRYAKIASLNGRKNTRGELLNGL